MDLRSGILSSAQALGISPVDLATAISYETAGTFDPTKAGPTTQWGQHRGLIQFGEPQAEQYGVNWADPIGSQLGAEGAVVDYLRDTGVQPGMGLLDIYSAINAGGVGRYGASDANNGGAPGTVRDKVEQQMAGHREKAMQLLGGDYTPPPVEQMQPVNGGSTMQQGLLDMIQKEDTRTLGEKLKASAKDGSLFDALALGFNTMRGPMADQGLAQSVQARIEGRQEQAQTNQTAEWLAANGRPDLAEALTSGMIDGETAFAAMQAKAAEPVYQGGQWWDTSSGQPVALTEAAPEDPSLMNAGDGRIYNPATGEWIMAPDSGQQELPSAVQALQWRAQEAGLQPGTPEYAQFIIDGGRSDGFAIDVDPATGSVSVRQGSGAGASAKPFTEGQSKDNVFATRAEGALTALDPIAGTLTSRSERAAEMVPFGLARGMQTDEFQVAQNAGDEFLQAILRKDTGAAITEQEQMLYGKTYLPQPGDSEAVMAQKQQARRRAVEAIKAGMSPAQMIAQEKALAASGSESLQPIDQPAPAAPSAQPDFSTMNDAELDAWIAQNGG